MFYPFNSLITPFIEGGMLQATELACITSNQPNPLLLCSAGEAKS